MTDETVSVVDPVVHLVRVRVERLAAELDLLEDTLGLATPDLRRSLAPVVSFGRLLASELTQRLEPLWCQTCGEPIAGEPGHCCARMWC